MDIYNFALELEKDSCELYMKMAEECSLMQLKKIFELLISEEKKHIEMINKMKDAGKVIASKTNILPDSKKVFQELIKKKFEVKITYDFNDLLENAKIAETDSKNFYIEKAEISDDQDQKIMLLTLADEEDKHYILLGKIQEFLSRPNIWIENGEFNHLDDY